jgi:Domain of unknown function (DUF4149)
VSSAGAARAAYFGIAMKDNTFRVLLVLWAGSLWSLAAWVAVTLFRMLGSPALAGPIAARLFSIETYLGVVVAAGALTLAARRRLGALYGAVGLLLINESILKSLMRAALAAGGTFGLSFGGWHGVSMVIYVGACGCVLWVIWREPHRAGGLPPKK